MNKVNKEMFGWIKWINEHLFEILVVVSIIIIGIIALFRIKKKGSWSKDYYYPGPISGTPNNGGTHNTTTRKDSIGETRTREYLEKYFRKPFPKARPDFMVNTVTGSRYNLELDCYNPELQLAVEFHGIQHYQYTPFFHKSKEAFYNQKYRDEIKRIRCRELGIRLIEVPYTELPKLEQYLQNQIKLLGM